MTKLGDIKSESGDMSDKKSCEKHDRLLVEGFMHSIDLSNVNRSLRNPQKGCFSMGTLICKKL